MSDMEILVSSHCSAKQAQHHKSTLASLEDNYNLAMVIVDS